MDTVETVRGEHRASRAPRAAHEGIDGDVSERLSHARGSGARPPRPCETTGTGENARPARPVTHDAATPPSRQRARPVAERISVGRMADLNCVSPRTLRVYDEKGLLVPAERDDETGYRYYTLDQCATLDAIQRLQHIGFTLDEIRSMLAEGDTERLYDRLCVKERDIEDRIDSLIRARHLVSQLKTRCFVAQTDVRLGEFREEALPDRWALRFKLSEQGGLDSERSATEVLRDWQLCVCDVKRQMLAAGYPSVYFGNVACCIPAEQLRAGNLRYSEALVFVDDDDRDRIDKVERIPAGRYVTEYCNDLSADEGELRETQYLRGMLDHLAARGYQVAGDYIGEVVLDTELFSYHGRDELVKMQIRVSS